MQRVELRFCLPVFWVLLLVFGIVGLVQSQLYDWEWLGFGGVPVTEREFVAEKVTPPLYPAANSGGAIGKTPDSTGFYMFGGMRAAGFQCHSDLWYFSDATWSFLGEHPVNPNVNTNPAPLLWPGGRSDSALRVFNDTFFLVFGGWGWVDGGPGYIHNVWFFDTVENKWSFPPIIDDPLAMTWFSHTDSQEVGYTYPGGRNQFVSFLHDGSYYVTGGYRGATLSLLDLWTLDLDTLAWSSVVLVPDSAGFVNNERQTPHWRHGADFYIYSYTCYVWRHTVGSGQWVQLFTPGAGDCTAGSFTDPLLPPRRYNQHISTSFEASGPAIGILYGGYEPTPAGVRGDTWVFNLTSVAWEWTDIAGTNVPDCPNTALFPACRKDLQSTTLIDEVGATWFYIYGGLDLVSQRMGNMHRMRIDGPWKCNSILSDNDAAVCRGHGTCVSVDTCVCDSYKYDALDWCSKICLLHLGDLQCNGHGICDYNECDCSGGWEGALCQVKVDATGMKMSQSFSAIEGIVFDLIVDLDEMVPCAMLLDEATLGLLGVNPVCLLSGTEDLDIILGSGFTIRPGDPVGFDLTPLGFAYNNTFLLLPPDGAAPPVAIADGPTLISDCSSIGLDASRSTGPGLHFSWECLDGGLLDLYLASSLSSFVTIPSWMVLEGVHNFRLTVTSDYYAGTWTDDIAITKTTGDAPVFMIVPSQIVVSRNVPVVLTAISMINVTCLPGQVYNFQWRQISGPVLSLGGVDLAQRSVMIPRGVLDVVDTYEFAINVTNQDGLYSESYVTVEVVLPALDVEIVGGNRWVGFTEDVVLKSYVVDLEDSPGVRSFEWDCYVKGTATPCLASPIISTTAEATLTAADLATMGVDEYDITLTLTVDDRTAEDQMVLMVLPTSPTSVSIRRLPMDPFPNPTEPMSFTANVHLVGGDTLDEFEFDWSCTTLNFSKDVTYSTSGRIMVVAADAFLPSSVNPIHVDLVKVRDATVMSSSSIVVRTNGIPKLGGCEVYPSNGTVLTTKFTIVCSNWYDAHLPLTYQFYYKSPFFGWVELTQRTKQPLTVFDLPVSGIVELRARVYDDYRAYVDTEMSVDVTAAASLDASLATIYALDALAEASGSVYDQIEAVLRSAALVYDVKSSGGASEATLYRETLFAQLQALAAAASGEDTSLGLIQTALLLLSDSTGEDLGSIGDGLAGLIYSSVVDGVSTFTAEAVELALNAIGSAMPFVTDATARTQLADCAKMVHMQALSTTIDGVTRVFAAAGVTTVVVKQDHTDTGEGQTFDCADAGTSVEFPEEAFGSDPESSVGLVMSVMDESPYFGTVYSTVATIDVVVDDVPYVITGLSEGIVFTLSSDLDMGMLETDPTEPGYHAVCAFWDDIAGAWDSDGCECTSVSATEVEFSCTHLTDFAVLMGYITPKLNWLTLDDVKNIVLLDTDNLTTLIVLCAIMAGYMLSLIISQLWTMCCTFRRMVMKIADESLAKESLRQRRASNQDRPRYIQTCCHDCITTHKYLSVACPDSGETHYDASQRFTVIIVSILGSMLSNALTFGTREDGDTLQFLASVIVAGLITSPFSICFHFFFLHSRNPCTCCGRCPASNEEGASKADVELGETPAIRSRRPRKRPSRKEVTSVELFADDVFDSDDEVQMETESDEDPLIRGPIPSPEAQEKDFIKSNSSLFRMSIHNRRSQAIFGRSSTVLESGLRSAMSNRDIARKVSMMKTQPKIDKCLDPCNSCLHTIIESARSATARISCIGITVLIIGTLLYFACCAGVCALCYYFIDWLGTVGVSLLAVALFFVYVFVLEILFILAKLRKFNKVPEMAWDQRPTSTTVQLLVSAFVIGACCVGIVLLIALFLTVPNFPIEALSSAVLLLALMVGAMLLWLIFTLRTPKPGFTKLRDRFLMPCGLRYVTYFFAWMFMIVVSFVLTLYGIKFDSANPAMVGGATSQKWLLGSAMTSIEDVFVQEPVEIAIKTILLLLIAEFFEIAFFSTVRLVGQRK